MGLDMYLTSYPKVQEDGEVLRAEELIYWRKANFIHGWFVSNVQEGSDDCSSYEVDLETLYNLLIDINIVLDNIKSEHFDSVAERHMPTRSGFFFGSTDYDDYYIEELERTREKLNNILMSFDTDTYTLEYRSSW